jgi:hypothetical protein
MVIVIPLKVEKVIIPEHVRIADFLPGTVAKHR